MNLRFRAAEKFTAFQFHFNFQPLFDQDSPETPWKPQEHEDEHRYKSVWTQWRLQIGSIQNTELIELSIIYLVIARFNRIVNSFIIAYLMD